MLVCMLCNGMWLDPAEGAENDWVLDLPQADAAQALEIRCPRCANALAELTYELETGRMVVEWCSGCRGIWIEQDLASPLFAFVEECRTQYELAAPPEGEAVAPPVDAEPIGAADAPPVAEEASVATESAAEEDLSADAQLAMPEEAPGDVEPAADQEPPPEEEPATRRHWSADPEPAADEPPQSEGPPALPGFKFKSEESASVAAAPASGASLSFAESRAAGSPPPSAAAAPPPGRAWSCPRCGSELRHTRGPDKAMVRSCLRCRAVWVNPEDGPEAQWVYELPQAEAAQRTEVSCPRCAVVLEELLYHHANREIRASWCGGCRGIWIDQAMLAPLHALVDAAKSAAEAGDGAMPADDAGDSVHVGIAADAVAREPKASIFSRWNLLIAAGVIVALAAVYLLWVFVLRHEEEELFPITPEMQVGGATTGGPIIEATRALDRFYGARGRWPKDVADLKAFAAQQRLRFSPEYFAKFTMQPLPNGDLRVSYQQKAPPDLGIIDVSPPAAPAEKDANVAETPAPGAAP